MNILHNILHKKRSLLLPCLLSSLLFSGALVQAEPMVLSDRNLDAVAAGSGEVSGSGGAIIGNSSEASINQTGGVNLSESAQSGAKGLNLVNSAESTVANGVNVWDVNTNDTSVDSGEMMVDQSNVVNQEQRRSASMPSYSRPEANTFVQLDRDGNETHDIHLDRDNTVIDKHDLTSSQTNTSTASVDTTIKGGGSVGDDTLPKAEVDTNVGKGGAGAGTLDLIIDGGEAQIGLAVGGSVIAKADRITPSVDGNTESYGGMLVGDENSDFTLYGRLILPEITVELTGAGCGVAMGSCDASGSSTETNTETIDNSLMDTELSSSVGNSAQTENMSETYRSPFDLDNAQAEYIVVDDSSLTVNTTFNLSLAGNAQSDVRAMNVVNATGSAVANGVNVARTSGLGSNGAMSLQQSNVISHSR
jgi:hypothetical protein